MPSRRREIERSELSLPTGEHVTHVDVYDADEVWATAIFYHGNITHAAFYHNFLEELAARGVRVLAPDRIGMGRSSGRPGVFTAQDLWAQSNGLMDYIDEHFEGPFVTMGHSVGGTIAYEHFLAEPRIAACVANNIRHPSSEGLGPRDRVEFALFRACARILPRMPVDALGMIEGEAEGMSEPDRICLRRIMAEDAEETSGAFTIGSLAALIQFRAPVDHGNLDRPLLLIVGNLDTEQELILAQEAAEQIEGPLTLEVVPGAGHFMLETDYERSAEVIEKWLRKEVL